MDKSDAAEGRALRSNLDNSLNHYGIKGMKWGVHTKDGRRVELTTAGKLGFTAARKYKAPNKTKSTYQKKTAEAGGLHKLDDKALKAMNSRLEMEKKYTTFMNEEKERRKEGRKATLAFLGEVGKIALPVALGIAANKYYSNKSSGMYRTKAWASRPAITVLTKAIGA